MVLGLLISQRAVIPEGLASPQQRGCKRYEKKRFGKIQRTAGGQRTRAVGRFEYAGPYFISADSRAGRRGPAGDGTGPGGSRLESRFGIAAPSPGGARPDSRWQLCDLPVVRRRNRTTAVDGGALGGILHSMPAKMGRGTSGALSVEATTGRRGTAAAETRGLTGVAAASIQSSERSLGSRQESPTAEIPGVTTGLRWVHSPES